MRELAVGKPLAGGDIGGGRHLRRHRLGHVLVQVHYVVGRHFRQFAGGPGFQRERFVPGPIRALVVEIASQKGMDPLRAAPHVGIGRPGRVIPLVMLTRAVQLGQFIMDAVFGRFRLRRVVGGVEGQRRRAGKGRAHQSHRAEHVVAHEGAPGCDRSPEIMPRDHRDIAIAERRDQPQRVPDRVQNAKRAEVPIIFRVPPGRAAIAPLVGRHDPEARGGERQHHLSPGVGEFREAVQQQDQRPAACLEAGLQHMHSSPLMSRTNRDRMPDGRTSSCSGGNSVISTSRDL